MTQLAEHPAISPVPGRYRTAAEWWHALGNVPLERIVFDPWPGTATEADVIRLDEHEDRICELVDGTLVEKTMGFDESEIAMLIGRAILNFVRPRRLGKVTGEAGMMRIAKDRIRIPDIAFISFDRFPGRRIPKGPIPAIWPDLAVEVLSESNTRQEMLTKLKEYFAAGTRLVWYVDPETRTVEVFTSPKKVRRLDVKSKLTGGDVLPGFEVPVADIFDVE